METTALISDTRGVSLDHLAGNPTQTPTDKKNVGEWGEINVDDRSFPKFQEMLECTSGRWIWHKVEIVVLTFTKVNVYRSTSVTTEISEKSSTIQEASLEVEWSVKLKGFNEEGLDVRSVLFDYRCRYSVNSLKLSLAKITEELGIAVSIVVQQNISTRLEFSKEPNKNLLEFRTDNRIELIHLSDRILFPKVA